MVEQPPAGEDGTQMDMTNKLDMTNETDTANEKEPHMTNETDEENSAGGETVEVLQDDEPNLAQASETSDQETKSETVADRDAHDSTRRSERS